MLLLSFRNAECWVRVAVAVALSARPSCDEERGFSVAQEAPWPRGVHGSETAGGSSSRPQGGRREQVGCKKHQAQPLRRGAERFSAERWGFLPPTHTYGLKDGPSARQSQPAASSSSSAAKRPPCRISSSGGPTSTI
jgi:hypothetical protein